MEGKTKTYILIIILITFLTYVISLGNSFVWDDEVQIVGNAVIKNLNNLPLIFTSGIVYTPGQALSGGFYRPILTLCYMFLYAVSSNPFIFRFFQIITHCLNAVLVYLIFEKIFFNKKSALFGALFFSLHPGISEGVLFMAGIGEPIVTFFLLLSLILFLKKKVYFSAIIFFLALLTKENAVIFLPLVFLYNFFVSSNKLKLAILLIYLLPLSAYIILRGLIVGFSQNGLNFPAPIAQSPILIRFLTIPYEVFYYLKLALFPLNLSISQHPLVNSVSDIRFWGSLGLISGVFVLIIILGKKTKSKLLFFFSGWFFLSLVPVLNLIPLASTVAERWLYFPLIGFIGILLVLFDFLKTKFSFSSKIFSIFIIIVLCLFTIRTLIRSLNWQNGLALYQNDLKVNPNSFELQNNYGVELMRQGKIQEAQKYFEKSIELAPNWWTNYNNLGVVYESKGDNKKALTLYETAIDKGNYYLAFENISQIYLKTKDYPSCKKFLDQNIKYFPYSSNLFKIYAVCLYQLGDYENSLKMAKTALNLNPNQINYSLFQTILNKGKLE